jgi:ATPase subunit of ABC transporter with duplicated ATPase domains
MECLTAYNISYIQPDKEVLFEKINFSVREHDKVALIGNNGVGKSTLLKIFSGFYTPGHGKVQSTAKPYYLPQHYGQYNDYTVAEALQINVKLKALHKILKGKISNASLMTLNEDWHIEQRSLEALNYWDLNHISLWQKMDSLSGGEKTKIFLAGIMIHNSKIVLLDEPTNHLDLNSRNALYEYIRKSENTFVIVSHDRVLLDMLNPIYELYKSKIIVYGGNYTFYKIQKDAELHALKHKLKAKKKALQVAKKTAHEALERKNRADARGTKKHKGNIPPVMMHQLKNKAEKSATKLKGLHSEKIESISKDISRFRKELPEIDEMKMNFENTITYKGKILVDAQNINFTYHEKMIWNEPLKFQIRSGDRINIEGENGAGKTTLIRLMLGDLQPSSGKLNRSRSKAVYVDQEYSLIDNNLTVYEQAQQYNDGALQEHDIKIRLSRYLFNRESWIKPCSALSGGEKMKLALCCLMISHKAPDIFALDEPTNNLDIQNIEILTSAVKNYIGTIIVVSHDIHFLNEIGINRRIIMENKSVKFPDVYLT